MAKAGPPSSLHTAQVLLMLLALALTPFATGCSPQATATPAPTATPRPTRTPTPMPTPTPTPRPIDLAVVHTNDVLGYTEPCG
jgi:hypothetical protein